MERTPAACAMDWSIQLQKDLRSDIPGKSIDALQEIGRRLQRWNKDPKLTFAEHTMFGLFPEEDKLFLNAILLCLADAFSSGDKHTKECVVRIFMKIKRRGNRDAEGIFSKEMFENQLELLTRVKEVFDEGDTEERALSLRLFGCWAYFAKDCPDVRYIALSSLVTGDVLEVKAAYFAAGYLSETSDDFAVVFLEMLRTTVSSQESSEDIKLAAGRAFAKLWCSFSIAENAYKLGLKLLMDSSEDDFSATMLISLSKIASRWMLLVPTQFELLTLFQSEDRSLRMQVTSLRCFRLLLAREVCIVPSNASTVHRVFGILHRSELQPTLQLESLRLLYKYCCCITKIWPQYIHRVPHIIIFCRSF
ncbi:integrator complex subunit 7-like [Salvia splendens]|uniref:integrator complex subunit 7-like n=1 Tax=Salvia splendens TaxID=180675 RepID=UPI001C260E1A|nr:integrator complex subunit 7-like [Salvia splendens]